MISSEAYYVSENNQNYFRFLGIEDFDCVFQALTIDSTNKRISTRIIKHSMYEAVILFYRKGGTKKIEKAEWTAAVNQAEYLLLEWNREKREAFITKTVEELKHQQSELATFLK